MTTSVKQMLEAANAAVPKITPEQAADKIAKGNTRSSMSVTLPRSPPAARSPEP